MSLISTTDIAAARVAMEELLTDTAAHYAFTDTVSASGSTTQGFTLQGNISCLVYMNDRAPNENIDIGESKANVATHIVRLPYDANVKVGDRLVIGSDRFLIVADGDSDTNRFILSVGAQRIRKAK